MGSSVWVLAIMIGLSALSWIMGKIKEKQEIEAAKERMRKRREEQLRAGVRGPEPEDEASGGVGTASTAGDPEQERAERLRELRERRLRELQARQSPSGEVVLRSPDAPPRTARPTPRSTGAPGPARPVPQTRAQRVPPSARGPVVVTEGRGQRRREPSPNDRARLEAQARARDEQRRRVEQPEDSFDLLGEESASMPKRRDTQMSDAVRAMLFSHGASRERNMDRVRAAVALTEVLSSPMAMREDREMPWNRNMPS